MSAVVIAAVFICCVSIKELAAPLLKTSEGSDSLPDIFTAETL